MNSIIHTARQRKVVTIIVVGLLVCVVAYGYRCVGRKICGATILDQTVRSEASIVAPNGVKLSLEIADTPESREQGLSDRNGIHDNDGMLFVFDEPGKYAFWMKDMYFPIDMVWVNEDGVVVHVENNVSPDTYFLSKPPRVFVNGPQASYVLELKAGEAEKDGMYLGTHLIFE